MSSAADDARRRGISIAARIAEEFIRLVPTDWTDQSRADRLGSGPDPSVGSVLRNAQQQAERAVDAAVTSVLDALTSAFTVMDGLAQRSAGEAGCQDNADHVVHLRADVLGADDMSADGLEGMGSRSAVGRCWVHNTTGHPTSPLSFIVGELRSNHGHLLEALVTIEPSEVLSVAAGSSVEIVLTVSPKTGSAIGNYYGLLNATGIDQQPLMLCVTLSRADWSTSAR